MAAPDSQSSSSTSTSDMSSSSTSKPPSTLPPGMVLGPDGKPCKICTAFRNWKPGTTGGTEADSNRDKQQGSRTNKKQAAVNAGVGLAEFASMAASASSSSSQPTGTEGERPAEMSYRGDGPPPGCPPDVEVLGRSTWTFLHTAAAYFPDKPTPTQRASMISLLRSLAVVYPCTWCAVDFGDDLAANPPDVSSGEKLSRWLCERHNVVNRKLGKGEFDCSRVLERWRDGPKDGRSCPFPSSPSFRFLSPYSYTQGKMSSTTTGPQGHYRRSPHLVISIPGTRPMTPRPPFKPSGKLLFRYLPWVVACTILLWLFVLRSDSQPQGVGRPPGRGGHPHHYNGPPPAGAPWKPAVPAPEDTAFETEVEKPPSPWREPWKWAAGSQAKGTPKLGVWDGRAEKVKQAFVHAFEGYKRHAKGADELLPVVGSKINNFNGWGVTVFDSLDTMWIMGLHDLFRESMETVAKADFSVPPGDYAPFFETIIRYLGGLLSAYALSGEPILLARADDLGRMLMPAFDSPSGLPFFAVNTKTGQTKKGWAGDHLWSEVASNQMEYKYLAHVTGRKEYFVKTDGVLQKMYNTTLSRGLFPSKWDSNNGAPANEHYSVGAFADSAYEYMLKQWLLSSRSEPQALELYLKSADAIIDNLLFLTPRRRLLYVTDVNGASGPTHVLEHLSCFLPGLFALGVDTLSEDELEEEVRERHLWAAQGLAETCWVTYADTETGLGADEVLMEAWPRPTTTTPTTREEKEEEERREGRAVWDGRQDGEEDIGGRWVDHLERWEKGGRKGGVPPGVGAVKKAERGSRDWIAKKSAYLLRPETIESFYVLWKATGDVKWRERGWAVFEAIERHAKTQNGYASVSNVDVVPAQWLEEMPSYFLAETLKYLYLLFNEEDLISFDDWVFNTEAHPLPIFKWTAWEKEYFGVHTHTNGTEAPGDLGRSEGGS